MDSRRLAELEGLLLGVLGLLLLLSLASYHPFDPSPDTSAASWPLVRNWIGPTGSYLADVLFQTLGWTAWLTPVALFIVAARLVLGRPFHSPGAKLLGAALFIASLAALLELFPYTPRVFGFIHGSGLVGYFAVLGLAQTFNRVGAAIVAGTVFLASLFLVTRFSFSSAAQFAKARFAFAGRLRARWAVRREARQRERMKKKMERDRLLGKPPVVPRTVKPDGLGERTPMQEPLILLDDTDGRRAGPAPAVSVVHGQGLGETGEAGLIGGAARKASPRIARSGARPYKLPSSTLLRPPDEEEGVDEEELKERAIGLVDKFAEFGVTGAVTQIHPGPVVTTFEFKPEAGIKYSRITNLVDDLCLAMKAESILIERVAGKSTVGIEVPNLHREIIHLRELVESGEFAASSSKITLCLGKDITGRMKVADLAQMPHLLIAGSTGAGKSVAINSMIVSILYKSTPDDVRIIMIDPKRLELNLYEGIPHLFTPIVTEPKVAANVLRHATEEMENRLKKLAEHGVRNIEQYNKLFEPDSTLNLFDAEGARERPLPYLVIVIDELADLMMVEPQSVEESITRLAQMARAVGIHLILATQRPSVDVITGLIKANLPARISFRVASKVDSRTILDSNGSEALLGRGDMLFLPPASARLQRLHGPLVTEKEINKVVDWWKAQSRPEYNEDFLEPVRDKDAVGPGGSDGADGANEEEAAELDEVYEDAVRIVVESGKASTSLLQRRLRLGYGRAARLLDLMEKDGIISAPDGGRPREVLKRPDWLREVDETLR
ncbi:MAG TPA: DNA translocase FtsK 4TM domain-containing protein [Terriglobia bacterium]|nr:DNA translocase FtsK 4TM domain-containing protein [Terriglobia bacterium]